MAEIRPASANIGLNLSSSTSQIKEGELTYAMNATLEGLEGNKVNYQNELGNVLCVDFPKDYRVVGLKNVIEKDFTLVMLANPVTNQSEIGKVKGCTYEKVINADCLNFSIERPIYKIHTKITNCSTEFYWRDPIMRWIDLDNLPWRQEDNPDNCEPLISNEVDCNKLKIQPNFSVPSIEYVGEESGGEIVEGTYEFAIQYSNALGDGYTQYYGFSNPISVFNKFKGLTQDFNTVTGKSIAFKINDIDTSGVYDYINIAVIKTINLITSVELIETRKITSPSTTIIYTGIGKSNIRLTIDDVKERFPIYEKAGDSFEVQDVLGWDDLTTTQRVNYQKIFNKLSLGWETHRVPADRGYNIALHTANMKGYMRDESYVFEGAFVMRNGSISDGFHIPNRPPTAYDLEPISNSDTETGEKCELTSILPRWKTYNTAVSLGKIKECTSTTNQTSFGVGTVSLFCSDNNCSQQGSVSLDFTFDIATPEPITLLIGSISLSDFWLGGATNVRIATGYDIYTLPDGVIPYEPYYLGKSNLPFEVHIPAGVTSYHIPAPIFLQGYTDLGTSTFICQNCAFPVTDLYLKAITNSNYKITFTSPQPLVINNIYPDVPHEPLIVDNEPCADECYEGVWEWGEFGYAEETDLYPCEKEIWGDLADQPIRIHKFPDSSITHIHDDKGYIYPLAVRFSIDQLKELIRNSDLTEDQKRNIVGIKILRGNRATRESVVAKGLIYNVGQYTKDKQTHFYPNYPFNDLRKDPFLNTVHTKDDSGSNYGTSLDGFVLDDSKKRYTFHSPDTHFNQPSLGNVLKLETIEYGESKGHIVQVKDHARYKFLTKGTYKVALDAALLVGIVSNEVGLTVKVFDGAAAYAAFSALVSIIDKTTPRENFAYQSNSLGEYSKYLPIPNNGNKIRNIDIINYLIPGMTSAGDVHPINNFQRESSVYLRTTNTLPFPHEVGGPEDTSRWTLSSESICDDWGDIKIKPISAYYASVKRYLLSQYGPIYSYTTIDTGFQFPLDVYSNQIEGNRTVFGGDVFISKFALKRKLPFFIDNRVKWADDSDIFYNDLGNVAYPTYWMSTDYKGDGQGSSGRAGISRMFGVKINNFDCKDDTKFHQRGKFYLFAYGISYFFVESTVNVDYRQAFNDKEGDFFPHVGEDIPDEWLQESKTTINQDNTYVYNKTYSKQNKETIFTHLPPDFDSKCFLNFPNKAIYSDQQSDLINYKKNNWLIYRPISQFDFPLNYGKLTSIEGMENRAILARFENKSLIYNALLTINTSVPQAAYLGNDSLFKGSPPLDFVDTELGFNGSQHKFYLKTEAGSISVDAKRGEVLLIVGNKANKLSEFKVDAFFNEHLKFTLSDYFPISTDNHFNGVGISGVWDNRFNRVIITKLDYEPRDLSITYKEGRFFYKDKVVELTDNKYFINKSFTISFDLDNKAWISFHSYTPNFYVGSNKKFFSGVNGNSTGLWEHYKNIALYNNFYGIISPYILEYPFSYKINDEILQSVSDYTKVIKWISPVSSIVSSDNYFNKAIIYNDEQCSGVLNLVAKPKSARAYNQYPVYKTDGKDILFTKSANFYNYNEFWDVTKDYSHPNWLESENKLDKDLNTSNMDYSSRSFKKYPIRGKDVKIRHILDNTSNYNLISQFIVTLTQTSFK